MALTHAEIRRRFYVRHREEILAKCRTPEFKEKYRKNSAAINKRHYARNAERLREEKRAWRQNNRDKHRAQKRAHYHRHKEKIQAQQRERYQRHSERIKQRARAYNKRPGVLRRNMLRKKYGITPEQYDAMLRAQHGVCAICRQPETAVRKGVLLPLVVDHDHATNVNRGLLCACCNIGIGGLRDDPAILRAAIAYIELFRT